MKNYFLLPVLLLGLFVFVKAQPSNPKKKNREVKVKELPDSFVITDTHLKGPNGEAVFIDSNGDRYYMKGKQKVFVTLKSSRKATA